MEVVLIVFLCFYLYKQKSGVGDKVIRRNSLTTLHPLPRAEAQPSPELERQRTVPHGFNVSIVSTERWASDSEDVGSFTHNAIIFFLYV